MIEIHHIRNEELRSAYDTLYDERPIQHSDSFYVWILKLMKIKSGSTLLDIACGQGRLIELAKEYGIKGFGSDISFMALQASSVKGDRLLVCDGQAIPVCDSTFDYVSNIGSLEHYVDPIEGAREMARILKPGGTACILLPNTFGIFSTVLYAFHHGRIADDGQPIQRYGTRYTWQDLLEKNGLKVIATYKYECEWPLVLKDWIIYLKKPKAIIRLLLTPILPLNLANSFVYICTRQEN